MKLITFALFVLTSMSSFAKVDTICLQDISGSNGIYVGKNISTKKETRIGLGISRNSIQESMNSSFQLFIDDGYNFSPKSIGYIVCLVNPEISNNNVNYIDGFFFVKKN